MTRVDAEILVNTWLAEWDVTVEPEMVADLIERLAS